jgi:hypothetical protein
MKDYKRDERETRLGAGHNERSRQRDMQTPRLEQRNQKLRERDANSFLGQDKAEKTHKTNIH